MNAIAPHTVPPHLLTELAMHLRNSSSDHSVKQAVTAIRAWITANTPRPSPAPADPGFQWKSLFLPNGTELRMTTRESPYHARVEGEHIMFRGRRVSPRGITLAVADEGRNAWRDVWLKLPGERYWKQAVRCRSDRQRSIRSQSASEPAAVANTVLAAAVTVSDALMSMLELIERAGARPAQAEDRRIMPARRAGDALAEHRAFD